MSNNKVKVDNLSPGVDGALLEITFSAYGRVFKSTVTDTSAGRSGTVTYGLRSHGDDAIKAMDGAKFFGHKVSVKRGRNY